VNGYWIRRELGKSFPNYGSRNTFKFIPKNEFWIDFDNKNKEARFIIINFLSFMKALKNGKTEKEAMKICSRQEMKERGKLKWVEKLRKIKSREKLLGKVHEKQLFKNKTRKIKIWLVRGKIVRSVFDVDFNQGGQGLMFKFIPKDEIWIDDSLRSKERGFVLVHELHERKLMKKGWKYDCFGIGKTCRIKGDSKKYAHPAAEDLEFWLRHHENRLKNMLLKEIRENEELG
jgi:hypothetical protein